jgi:hypothetical protein
MAKQEEKCHKTVIVEGNAEKTTASTHAETEESGRMALVRSVKGHGTPEDGTTNREIVVLTWKMMSTISTLSEI